MVVTNSRHGPNPTIASKCNRKRTSALWSCCPSIQLFHMLLPCTTSCLSMKYVDDKSWLLFFFFLKEEKKNTTGRLQRPCWMKIRCCLSHWRKLTQKEHYSFVLNNLQAACHSISWALVILGVNNSINTNFLVKKIPAILIPSRTCVLYVKYE